MLITQYETLRGAVLGNALPPEAYLPCFRNAVWDEHELVPGQLLYDIQKPMAEPPDYAERATSHKLAEQVEDLRAKLLISENHNARFAARIEELDADLDQREIDIANYRAELHRLELKQQEINAIQGQNPAEGIPSELVA